MGSTSEITCSCPTCGEVKVRPAGMSLVITADDSGHYVFQCPKCRDTFTRPAPEGTVKLLRSIGVLATRVGHDRADAALDEDDLIEFGRALEGGDPWSELGASQPG